MGAACFSASAAERHHLPRPVALIETRERSKLVVPDVTEGGRSDSREYTELCDTISTADVRKRASLSMCTTYAHGITTSLCTSAQTLMGPTYR